MNRIAVIIVAGGSGLRMGASLPKQFLLLGGRPILMRTIERFHDAVPDVHIVLVLPQSRKAYWQTLCEEYDFRIPHTVCEGGETRFASVRSGLQQIDGAGIVAVHDAVRPLVSVALIRRTIEDAMRFGAVVPVVTPTDSLRRIEQEGSRIVDRRLYRIVQTPQVFKSELLLTAYEQPYQASFTDDASVVEASGVQVYLCQGEYSNIKITTPVDRIAAEALLEL